MYRFVWKEFSFRRSDLDVMARHVKEVTLDLQRSELIIFSKLKISEEGLM